MKPLKNILVLFCSLLMLAASCKKEKSKNPIDDLPPATQTGANTFGCLINGEIWKPKGGLLDRTLDLSYDPGYMGGTFNVLANRLISQGVKESITIGSYNIKSTGSYVISEDKVIIYYSNSKCTYLGSEKDNVQTGTLTISRLDLQAKIISGTFNFKLEKTGCPTIIATEGRFDLPIE
ncbi:MAG: hypothetical protein EAZ51_01875 [Sphingobacteriales bacterium]|nr:MAG: hypothetical protein EAY66_00005 [Sphingobacteriales bacterium]TAF45103.1 MAG: hypothetical protein EAZ64_04965 [Sphingobacteriales bacterium]TAF82846.1 MAG: hypothetical protein EAZ51_01875 [Sphingobacteriales bacterium]